jgi:tetratricopeptide (TPR) repeat protein
MSSYQTAVNLYRTSLEIDSSFAKAYTGLAKAYFNRYFWETYFKENFLDTSLVLANIALSFDDKEDEAYYLKGLIYWANGNFEEALDNFDNALKINPNYILAYIQKGSILASKFDFVKGIENYHKALNLARGDERPSLLRNLGTAYMYVGFIDKAKYYYQEALALDSNKVLNLSGLAWTELANENYEEAYKLVKRREEIDSTLTMDIIFYSIPPGHNNEAY